jgi:hypothetical protein
MHPFRFETLQTLQWSTTVYMQYKANDFSINVAQYSRANASSAQYDTAEVFEASCKPVNARVRMPRCNQ